MIRNLVVQKIPTDIEDLTSKLIQLPKRQRLEIARFLLLKTRILEEAYKELNSAIDYYEGEQDGLGLRMFEEFERHVNWISENSEFVPVDASIRDRATDVQKSLGIKSYDALHIACAEKGGVDVFLSTDDRLISAVERQQEATKIKISNPLMWLQSMIK